MLCHAPSLFELASCEAERWKLTDASAVAIAFQRLPVAAYTGAATITPCIIKVTTSDSRTALLCPKAQNHVQ